MNYIIDEKGLILTEVDMVEACKTAVINYLIVCQEIMNNNYDFLIKEIKNTTVTYENSSTLLKYFKMLMKKILDQFKYKGVNGFCTIFKNEKIIITIEEEDKIGYKYFDDFVEMNPDQKNNFKNGHLGIFYNIENIQ